jgi:hypothetical protein
MVTRGKKQEDFVTFNHRFLFHVVSVNEFEEFNSTFSFYVTPRLFQCFTDGDTEICNDCPGLLSDNPLPGLACSMSLWATDSVPRHQTSQPCEPYLRLCQAPAVTPSFLGTCVPEGPWWVWENYESCLWISLDGGNRKPGKLNLLASQLD